MFREISVINFDHTGQMIFNYFNDVIYYCNDYYIRGYYFSFIKRHLIESEKTVIRRSRFCIATSDFLLHYLIKHNNNVHLVKLGAPEVNFTSNITTKSNHLISVSLVGFIDSKRISVDLVKVIIANPYIKLYIFGPVKHEFRKKFKEAKNIHFKGIKTGNDLHTELLKTDVGIIPYFKKDNNPGRTPNKLWLYLALGLPVVVTDIDNIKNWKFEKGIIYRVNDNEDFVIKIKKAYNDNTNILINKRIKEAQNNSWEKRVNELLDIYNKYGNQ